MDQHKFLVFELLKVEGNDGFETMASLGLESCTSISLRCEVYNSTQRRDVKMTSFVDYFHTKIYAFNV